MACRLLVRASNTPRFAAAVADEGENAQHSHRLIRTAARELSPTITLPAYEPSVLALSTAGGKWNVACAIVDSQVRCWGGDPTGILTGYAQAQPSTTSSTLFSSQDFTCFDEPLVTAPPIEFSPSGASIAERPEEIVMARTVACVRFESGGVRCWGDGFSPRFGDGQSGNTRRAEDLSTRSNIVLPTQPGGGPFQAAQLASSERHVCAVSSEGMLACWGHGGEGKLGQGSTQDYGGSANPTIPAVPLPSGVTVVRAAATGSSTCVLSSSAEVFCWGAAPYHGYVGLSTVGDDP